MRYAQLIFAFAFKFAVLLSGYACIAQVDSPQPSVNKDCDSELSARKENWAKTKHKWLANVFHKEDSDISDTWCRIGESQGLDRIRKIEDFGRTVFTGDGVHPVGGSIVPGSGLAAGVAFNLERAMKSHPVRYSSNIEARGSLNSFWIAGGKVDLLGSGHRDDNRHNHVVFSITHSSLPQLEYFGLGNSSGVTNESLYGLTQTRTDVSAEIPIPKGFTLSANLAGLWDSPQSFHGSSTPSIEQIFNSNNTPALNTDTTYVIVGGGIGWEYPVEERERGYRTSVATSFQDFHEIEAAPFSFRRFDVGWIQSYTPDLGRKRRNVNLGTVSLLSRLVESISPAGNNVPFYLQPTLGGTDINNQDVLRSYRDYRFRAPNALSFQTEYERAIVGPFGMLLFYDVGKVAAQRSDLDISHMRHSFGIGTTVRVGGAPVFKLYYAFAGREGTHTNYTGNTNNFVAKGPLGPMFQ